MQPRRSASRKVRCCAPTNQHNQIKEAERENNKNEILEVLHENKTFGHCHSLLRCLHCCFCANRNQIHHTLSTQPEQPRAKEKLRHSLASRMAKAVAANASRIFSSPQRPDGFSFKQNRLQQTHAPRRVSRAKAFGRIQHHSRQTRAQQQSPRSFHRREIARRGLLHHTNAHAPISCDRDGEERAESGVHNTTEHNGVPLENFTRLFKFSKALRQNAAEHSGVPMKFFAWGDEAAESLPKERYFYGCASRGISASTKSQTFCAAAKASSNSSREGSMKSPG